MSQLSFRVLIIILTVSHLFCVQLNASCNGIRVRLCSCTFVLTASCCLCFKRREKKRQRYTLIDFLLQIQLECGPSKRLLIRRPIYRACRSNRAAFCKIDITNRSVKRGTKLSTYIPNCIMANGGTNL
jgi:hypothetical protein